MQKDAKSVIFIRCTVVIAILDSSIDVFGLVWLQKGGHFTSTKISKIYTICLSKILY